MNRNVTLMWLNKSVVIINTIKVNECVNTKYI